MAAHESDRVACSRSHGQGGGRGDRISTRGCVRGVVQAGLWSDTKSMDSSTREVEVKSVVTIRHGTANQRRGFDRHASPCRFALFGALRLTRHSRSGSPFGRSSTLSVVVHAPLTARPLHPCSGARRTRLTLLRCGQPPRPCGVVRRMRPSRTPVRCCFIVPIHAPMLQWRYPRHYPP